MKKVWITYGFLGLMLVALVTLAVLQYHWLGSVSDAEKERLEENLSAASENFVADFNQVFSQTAQSFRIQVTNPAPELESLINTLYLDWITNSNYADIVDSIFVVRPMESGDEGVFFFTSDPASLDLIEPDVHLSEWLDESYNKSGSVKRVSIGGHPEFGVKTYMPVPIQFLDMIQIRNESLNQDIALSLSVDQLDDVLLLQLDNDLIKEELIPNIARRYFSNSFDDQYLLEIVKEDPESELYYTSDEDLSVEAPDFKTSLHEFDISNVLIFQAAGTQFPHSQLNKIEEFSDLERHGLRIDRSDSPVDSISEEIAVRGRFFSESFSSVTVNSSSDSLRTVRRDTVISSSFAGALGASGWELWLSFKEGSLDAFVNKTRFRNLGISFGILGILGISVAMIVVFSQRSRDLADQQMLFVAGVSHELRTPISVIRSAAENLNEGVVNTEERKKEYAKLMIAESRRLSDMVDQIMEFSGIQGGKRIYHYMNVEIEPLISVIQEESRHLLEEKGVQMQHSVNTSHQHITADKDALFLVVMNLISNAIKFSDSSKKIILRVDDVQLRGKPALQISVQDFGIGIPADEQEKIFQPFFRGTKPVDNQIKGNGIGLSLVEKVIRAHKGEISLKTKENEGTTFFATIPVERDNVG
ncbi:MAG: sensor histidine kinase [Balneola sp.]|nr:MAG: sensor histidine kinase [Balneola sp.]